MTETESPVLSADELIRVVVLTNPWSTVQKFPELKKIHVIRSEGFANAKGIHMGMTEGRFLTPRQILYSASNIG